MTFLRQTLSATVGALIVATGLAQAQTLTIVNQGGAPAEAQRQAIFEPFSKETGIKITVDTYNQELAKIRAQIETKNLTWDVASLNPINERAGCEEGLLEKIDWKSACSTKSRSRPIGGFGDCGAPYLVSPGALVYDAAKFPGDAGPKTWADFWDVKKFPGKRGLMYQPDQTLEVALIADGVAPPTCQGVDRTGRRRPRVQEARRDQAARALVEERRRIRCSSSSPAKSTWSMRGRAA